MKVHLLPIPKNEEIGTLSVSQPFGFKNAEKIPNSSNFPDSTVAETLRGPIPLFPIFFWRHLQPRSLNYTHICSVETSPATGKTGNSGFRPCGCTLAQRKGLPPGTWQMGPPKQVGFWVLGFLCRIPESCTGRRMSPRKISTSRHAECYSFWYREKMQKLCSGSGQKHLNRHTIIQAQNLESMRLAEKLWKTQFWCWSKTKQWAKMDPTNEKRSEQSEIVWRIRKYGKIGLKPT